MTPPPTPRPGRSPAGALLAALLLAGCSFAPPPSVPEAAADMPGAFAVDTAAMAAADAAGGAGAGGGEARDAREWWTSFRDPVLDAVVDSVLAASFDLAEAVARVQQARARAGIARAALFPTVQARAAASEQSFPSNTGIGKQLRDLGGGELPGGAPLPDRFQIPDYLLGVDFAYELDFWGRARNDSKAAAMDYLASESDYRAARIGVLSETIATYFEIADLRRRVELAGAAVALLGERADLERTRYARGLATSLDLYQVRRQFRNAQAGLPQLRTALVDAEGRLAVLLGGYRSKLEAILGDSPAPAPTADPVAAGVPADLLLQRPDVRAAGQRLEAARFAVGARRAELLPSLSFSGSIGARAAETGGLFNADQWFRNLLGNLTAPIFQGGRIRAGIALARARLNEAAAAYGRTVVTAVHEVEGALAALRDEGERSDFLAAEREEALASVALQGRRYASGVGGYADFLDAQRTLLDVEAALAGSVRDLALARLAVHRSLGGEWTTPDEEAES